MKIIITDLTRFGPNKPIVCTAGVAEDGTVIRPMPYLNIDWCHQHKVHPGGILEGDFTSQNSVSPHIEDASYSNLKFLGPCTKAEFQNSLNRTCFSSLSAGFGVRIGRDKCIPIGSPLERSLVTIKVPATTFSIVQSSFQGGPKAIRAHFSDGDTAQLSYVSITDLGFFEFAKKHENDQQSFAEINRFIQGQADLYLRVGVGRAYKSNDREGYWIQLNGIYTFPDKLEYVRCYDCE